MIFVTVGSMFPFERLIRAMDEMAPTLPDETFFAQIGRGVYEPRNMPFARLLDAGTFRETLAASKLLVAHAGMGSAISAMEVRTPIVMLPRSMGFAEHTTDHQMATARWLRGRRGIYVATDDVTLRDAIVTALAASPADDAIPVSAPELFLNRIRGFIDGAPSTRR